MMLTFDQILYALSVVSFLCVYAIIRAGGYKNVKRVAARTGLGVLFLVAQCCSVTILCGKTNAEGTTPKRAAVFSDAIEMHGRLDNGADVNARDRFGRTVLMLAAYRGHNDVVRLLLERGADVNACDNDGRSVLTLAALYKRRETVRLLQSHSASQ